MKPGHWKLQGTLEYWLRGVHWDVASSNKTTHDQSQSYLQDEYAQCSRYHSKEPEDPADQIHRKEFSVVGVGSRALLVKEKEKSC